MAQVTEDTTTDEAEAQDAAETSDVAETVDAAETTDAAETVDAAEAADEATVESQPDVPAEVGGLPTHLVISEVAAAKEFLTGRFDDGDQISIDLSQMVKVDTAGYQLLSAFEEECRRRDIEVHWENAPESMVEGARSLGLDLALDAS